MRQVTFTQIEGISAQAILERFDSLQKEIANLKEHYQPKEPNEYLTREEVANFLKVSLTTLNDWRHKGLLIPQKAGTRVRYKRAEVEALLNR